MEEPFSLFGRKYPGKVLLIGEHAVLAGGEALAVAWPAFHARWGTGTPGRDSETAKQYHRALQDFVGWILQSHSSTFEWLDRDKLERDFHSTEPPWLESNIPIGYGLGSSGAVCAALADGFSKEMPAVSGAASIPLWKERFAELESWFHGSSSGVDPLIGWLYARAEGAALRYGGSRPPERIAESPLPHFDWQLELTDTGIARRTAPLVNAFTRRLSTEHAFADRIRDTLIPANAAAIAALLSGDGKAFGKALETISTFTLQHLDFLVPESARGDWETDLLRYQNGEPGAGLWKLCGAGGGGYLQRWTRKP